MTIRSSLTRALEKLFGCGHLDLTLTSTAVPGATRHYNSGQALRADVVNARVWLGIHFRFADTPPQSRGKPRGLDLRHYIQPVKHHG
jgi:L-ascorbate metabolism protein UlaG (beta-lactamase superfamily)